MSNESVLLKVVVPSHSILYTRLNEQTVELIRSNNLYADCYHKDFGNLQIPVDWLMTDNGRTFQEYNEID